MYEIFVSVNFIAIILMIFMIVWATARRSSKVQMSFILSVFLTLLFLLCYHISITSCRSYEVNYVLVKIQYFSQCCLLFTYLWFFSEITRIHIPTYVYMLQGVIETAVLISVITMEDHTFFYQKVWMDTTGFFITFSVKPGIFFWVHYINFACIFLFTEIAGWMIYRRSGKVQKKRILCMNLGFAFVGIELVLKQAGFFGNYNMIAFSLTGMMLCFFVSFVRYGYFNSVQIAMENVLNHGTEAMIVLSEVNQVLYYNEMAKKLIPKLNQGMQTEQVPILCEALKHQVKEVTLQGCIYEMRTETLLEENDISGYVIWMIDMTSYYENLAELETMREKAEVSNHAKSAFLANMSHEIRTPINAVLGMDEMILRESREHDVRKYASDIQKAGKLLLTLINDILDFSKIESGKMEIVPAEYQLSSLLNDVVNMIEPKVKEKELVFDIQVDPVLPQYLFGDEMRVKQVITNLLTNAIKYTEKGSVILKMGGSYSADSRCISLCVTVSDTGRGIKKEDINKLFDSFCRLEENRNQGIEGTGLGLKISKQLAEKMEGSLKVESTYGVGSEFTFIVPQGVLREEKLGEYRKHYEENQQNENRYRERFVAPKASVLVVDDNDMNLTVVKSLLKSTKVIVDTAKSGAECLSRIQQKKYDVIFMDHLMPDMDGIETLKCMRNLTGNLCMDTPVIVLTANAVSGEKQNYIRAGFSDYLTKPVSGERLEDTLLKFLPKNLLIQDASQLEHEQEIQKKEYDSQAELLASYGIILGDGLNYMNHNMDEYRELLYSFYHNSETMASGMFDYIRYGDITNYQIMVHGLKSNAKNIGANHLSELAASSEKMSKEGNISYVSDHWKLLKTNWDVVLFGIQVYLGDDLLSSVSEVQPEGKRLTKEDLTHNIREIISLIDEFEIDKASLQIRKLLQFDHEEAIRTGLEKALRCVEEFEYDNAIVQLKSCRQFAVKEEKKTF